MTDALANPTLEQYEKLVPQFAIPVSGQVKVVFNTPNRLVLARAQTLFTKEPETVEWISSFNAGDVLLDVGANVGLYTVWAAVTRGVTVYAFEPEAQNYALLNRNLVTNRITDKVMAWCAGLSDKEGFVKLYLNSHGLGDSGHTIGENTNHVLEAREREYIQGGISTTVDLVIARGDMAVPNHIKIDVDGLEHRVIAGAEKTLQDPTVKSVLIELNTNLPEHLGILEKLVALGFSIDKEKTNEGMSGEGVFAGLANHIFTRSQSGNL